LSYVAGAAVGPAALAAVDAVVVVITIVLSGGEASDWERRRTMKVTSTSKANAPITTAVTAPMPIPPSSSPPSPLAEAGVSGSDIDAVAVTSGPGLVGSLLVGVSAAKALSLVWDVPFVAVNHLEAHLYASFLEEPDLELPLVVLLVSGGHTMLVLMEGHGRYRLLGSTLDDAAGEAFDKVARYLDLGYPGGPAIDALSGEGDLAAFDYPRSMVQENPDTLPEDRRYAFSFSGLKTAVVNHVRSDPGVATADVAASFQEAVVDALVTKTRWAIEATGARGACLGGGVAANSRLRERFLDVCTETGVRAFLPSRAMCTDNAAMVAAAGWWRLGSDGPSPLDTGADPNLGLPLLP
jgi:N6-L-threonylcarbamoyladenine synthase